MATMKDVASLSGVSIATVSNYLNGTKHVGQDKRLKIEKAIKELNYVIDPNAQLLRKGESRKIGVVLPSMNTYYSSMYEGILCIATKNSYKVELIITNESKETESSCIEEFLKEKISGIIIITCQPDNDAFFQRLKNEGPPFVLLDREIYSKDFNYVGFDNYNTTQKIIKVLLKVTDKIALVVGPEGYRSEDDCVKAFKDAYGNAGKQFIDNSIVRTKISEGNSFYDTIAFLQQFHVQVEYFITSSHIIAKGVKSASDTIIPNNKFKVICIGDNVDDVFVNADSISKTPRSPYSLGTRGAEILIENINSPVIYETQVNLVKDHNKLLEYFSVTLINNTKNTYTFKNETVKVLILEDPISGGLRSILPLFEHNTGIKVEVESCSMNNYYEYLLNRLKSEVMPDMFLIDVPWLDYFAANNMIEPLGEYLKQHKEYIDTFVPKLAKSFGESGGKMYAFPYSYTNQLLFYRKDLFEDIELRRRFEEEYKMPLKPPKNWVEFNAIARFFTREFNKNSPVEYGTSLAVAYPQAVAPEFLLRLWSLGGDIFDSKGNVIIDSRQSKRAIENYCECFKYATPNSFVNMPSDQMKEFCHGKAAMVVAFFSYGADIIHSSGMINIDKLGFSIVPGRVSVLSGWSLCINAKSKNKDAAFELLKWLCGPEMAIKRAFLEGQSSQEHAYYSRELLRFYPWLSTALKSLEYTSKRYIPKIAGRYHEPERTVEDRVGKLIYGVLKAPEKIDDIVYDYKKKLQQLITME
jgi:multiple sugar transport system substrate-binding protein